MPEDVVYGIARIDSSGRICERAVVTALGWAGGDRLTFSADAGVVTARRDPGGMVTLPASAYITIPAAQVPKPRRLPSTRRALADARLAEINQVAATTGDDPELDTLILRLHTETACRRGGALALRPRDLDRDQCLIMLREKGETFRWQPVSPTLMAALAQHAEERHAPPNERLLRYRNGRQITDRRYDHLLGPCREGAALGPHPGDQHPLDSSYDADLGGAELRPGGRPRLRRPHRRQGGRRHRHDDVRARHAHRGRHGPVRADRRAPPARESGGGPV
jgi:hypothetical protein